MTTYGQDGGSDGEGDRERPRGRWTDRVRFNDDVGGSSFAYRPGEVLTTGGEAALVKSQGRNRGVRQIDTFGPFILIGGVEDPVAEAELLRLEGFPAQPNHVVFAHCGGCCPPHPAAGCGGSATANPVYATPVYATPVYATPVYATPVYATPVYATPVYATPVYATPASPYRTTGLRRSSVRPAPIETPVAALAETIATAPVSNCPRVIVLDTGLSRPEFLPDFGGASVQSAGAADVDAPDEDDPTDGFLDPAAGHGTFIAGLVGQVAPGCAVTIHRVLSTFGDGDEAVIAKCVYGIAEGIRALPDADRERTVLSLSFGGYTLKEPQALAWAVAQVQAQGVVVVASAGNDATCRPTLPAALPGVVSVGAVGPNGPAPFSNYGPWVRACAPGVDLLSTYFRDFDGATPATTEGVDPDRFDGWALWSGTSFSAPVVAGALARMMISDDDCSPQEAVKRVIDAPSLMRIPNLGTVVNVI